jgi:site-specific recombinase XerD
VLSVPALGSSSYVQNAFQVLQLKPHDFRHGVAMEMYGEHGDLEKVRALLGHQRIDTTQIYASIRPTQLKRSSWRQRRVGC